MGNAVCSCYPCCPFKTEIKPFLLAVPRSPDSVESRKVEKYIPNMFSSFLHHPTYFTTTKKVKDGKSSTQLSLFMRSLGVRKRIPLPSVGRSELVESGMSKRYNSSLYVSAEAVALRAACQTEQGWSMAGHDRQVSDSRCGSEGQRTRTREVIRCPTLCVATDRGRHNQGPGKAG